MTMRIMASLFVAGCCLMLTGCPRSDAPSPADADQRTHGDGVSLEPVAPTLEYVVPEGGPASARATVVAGYPLVYTRQVLPVDEDGEIAADSAKEQCERALDNLSSLLSGVGSGLDSLVQLHVSGDSPETLDTFCEQLEQALPEAVRPAITRVVTPLPMPQAKVGVDAVAVGAERGSAVEWINSGAIAGASDSADAAVMPPGGVVYFSGRAERGEPAEAADKALSALWEMMDQLQVSSSDIVRLRVYADSQATAEAARRAIRRRFGDSNSPPATFAEWMASAPVEIEMVAALPPEAQRGGELVRYYNPPDTDPSPNFSRVVVVQGGRQILVSGLVAREPGEGESQVRDIFAQLEELLGNTGSDMEHLAKAHYYVSDDEGSSALDRLRREYFHPQRPPAASKAMVHGVGHAERSVEIDMVAVAPGE